MNYIFQFFQFLSSHQYEYIIKDNIALGYKDILISGYTPILYYFYQALMVSSSVPI